MSFPLKTEAVVALARRFNVDAAAVSLGVLLLVTTILNFTALRGFGLVIDEVWTGMIASQSSVAGLIHQCEIEVNGPLSYVISWLWAPFGGLSDAGLRLPSTLFACATPFVALAPSRLIPRGVRMIWAALLACWLPDFNFAQLARCYALVVLLATANTVAFAQVIRRPSLGAALLWAFLSALLILDHYFALALVACQGLSYLALRRGRALRTWPAALLFVPVFAELALKISLLSSFSKPSVSWIDRVTWAGVPNIFGFMAGRPFLAAVIGIGLGVGWVLEKRRPRQPDTPSWAVDRDGLSIAALMAALSAIIVVGLGFFFPILSLRYIAIEVPGVMLGVALLAARFARAWPLLPIWLMAGAVSGVISLAWQAAFIYPAAAKARVGLEPAFTTLVADNPRRLLFFRDNPTAEGEDLDQLSQVGGFFFKRTGHPIPVEAVPWVRGADPNALLLSRATMPGTDILWLFDRDVQGTAAVQRPPNISQRDPRWTCHDFGEGLVGILACHRGGRI